MNRGLLACRLPCLLTEGHAHVGILMATLGDGGQSCPVAGVSSPGHGCRNRTVSCQVHQRGKGLLEVWLLRPIDVMLCHIHWTQFPIACSRSFVPQPWNPWGLVAVVAWQISCLWRGIYCHDAGLVCARTTDQVESRESSRDKRLGNTFFFFPCPTPEPFPLAYARK